MLIKSVLTVINISSALKLKRYQIWLYRASRIFSSAKSSNHQARNQ